MAPIAERQATGVRVTVVILSHRGDMCVDAWRSVMAQTYKQKHPLAVQVLVQHCGDYWYGKLNEAASIAQGEYLVILCDDDLLAPTFLEELLTVVDAAGTVPDLLYTDRVAFRHVWRKWFGIRMAMSLGIRFRLWGGRFTLKMLAKDAKAKKSWDAPAGRVNKGFYWTAVPPQHFATGHWLPMTMMIRTDYWRALGGYNDSVSHADTEFWFRAAKRGGFFAYVPRMLFWYRRHKTQFSQESPSLENAMREFSRAHFDDHGMLWEVAREVQPGMFQVPKVPAHLRDVFKRAVQAGVTPRAAFRALRKKQDRDRRENPAALARLEQDAMTALAKSEELRLNQWLPK